MGWYDWFGLTALGAVVYCAVRAFPRPRFQLWVGAAVLGAIAWTVTMHTAQVRWLLDHTAFAPRFMCGPGWEPWLVRLHLLGEAMTAVAYLIIPIELIRAYRERRDTKEDMPSAAVWLAWLFASFIALCGIGHALGYLMFSQPMYRLDGLVRLATGAVSIATALVLPGVLKRLIGLPSLAELERARQRVYEEAQLFDKAFQEAPNGMAIVGIDGTFQRVNHALAAMLGIPPETLIELTLQSVTHDEDWPQLSERLVKLRNGDIPRCAIRARMTPEGPGGRIVWAALSVSMLRDAHTRAPLFFISHFQDVTELVEQERKLSEQKAAIERKNDALSRELTDLRDVRRRAADDGFDRAVSQLDRVIERLTVARAPKQETEDQ